MSTHELQSKLQDLRQLQALIEEAELEAEAIKDQIKAHMGTLEELRIGEYKVTWKAIISSRIDTKALQKTMPDLCQQYSKKTTVRRFSVA